MTNKEILDELRQPVGELRERIPAVFEGHGAMNAAVFADGAPCCGSRRKRALLPPHVGEMMPLVQMSRMNWLSR